MESILFAVHAHCWIAEVIFELLEVPIRVGKFLLVAVGFCDGISRTGGVPGYDKAEFREAHWR